VTAPSQTDFLTAYTEGFAVLLANAGIGLTWHAAGEYAPTEVGIFIAAVPTSPDKLVTLTPTPMDANPTLTDSRVDLQIRYRAGQDVRAGVGDAQRVPIRARRPVPGAAARPAYTSRRWSQLRRIARAGRLPPLVLGRQLPHPRDGAPHA
jgi:hypothetical protein